MEKISELIQKNKSEPINPTHISLAGKEECDNRNSKFIIDLIDAVIESREKAKKEQLDKNDPDNYGACYAIGGWNHAQDDAIKDLKAIKELL